MKKLLCTLVLFAAAGLFMPANAEPVYGFIYKDAVEAGIGSSNVVPTKEGCSVCRSWFGVVALGKCGIKDAMDQGKIKSLAFYDVHTKNIVVYKVVTTKAYGQ